MRMVSIVSVASLMSAQNMQAQDQYEYPELVVTPRASQRLQVEEKTEKSGAWTRYIPFQISAASTLYAGVSTMSDPGKPLSEKEKAEGLEPESKSAGKVAMLIGGGWLGTTVAMSLLYRPYKKGMSVIAGMKAGSKREILARERAAEEYIQAPASLMRKLKWLSVLSNFAASGYAAGTAEENGPLACGIRPSPTGCRFVSDHRPGKPLEVSTKVGQLLAAGGESKEIVSERTPTRRRAHDPLDPRVRRRGTRNRALLPAMRDAAQGSW